MKIMRQENSNKLIKKQNAFKRKIKNKKQIEK